MAQWLIQFGFTVKVIDFSNKMSTENLVEITRKHIDSQTVAIGVSTTFWWSTWPLTKDRTPPWVAAARPKLESTFPNLDWVLGGSGTRAQLIDKWIAFPEFSEDEVRTYLAEKLSIKKNWPLYNILTSTNTYMDGLGIRPDETLGIEWGRGCFFKCAFCRFHLNGKKKGTYLRDPVLVRQDMLFNYEKYGTTRYSYLDDTTNESPEKVAAMANVAQSLPFRIEWIGFGRLDLIGTNKSMSKILAESGLRSMFFGIETFNKEASKIIGKGWNGVHGKEFLLELKEIWGKEINFMLSFIVGLVPETSEELDTTLQWCIDNEIARTRYFNLNLLPVSGEGESEFDKNYSKYGYNFPDSARPFYWVNDPWTSATAAVKAMELDKAWAPHDRPAAWNLAEWSTISSMTMGEVMNCPEIYNNLARREAEIDKRIEEYVSYQLNLPE